MKNLLYFLQIIIVIIFFIFFKILGPSKSSYLSGKLFELIGPFFRSKKLINSYYKTVFQWLDKCEKFIGFDLEGYNKARMYAFLAERYLSYWFKKNSNYILWPMKFHDITNDNKNFYHNLSGGCFVDSSDV